MNPKPTQYYEAWYQAAFALQKQGQARHGQDDPRGAS